MVNLPQQQTGGIGGVMSRYAIIVGAGSGLSAALARTCAADGMKLILVARDIAKLAPLVAELGARAMACDASDPVAVDRLFTVAERDFGGAEDQRALELEDVGAVSLSLEGRHLL